MKPKPFRLALVQMQVRGGEREWNLHHALDLVAEAASDGAEVVLLPECMDLGWTHPSSLTMAEEIPGGKVCTALADAAKQHKIHICSGLTERCGDKIFNSSVFIDGYGEVLGRHRKLNELGIGHEYYAQGDRLNVVETEFCTFGMLICADGFAKDHVLARSLGYMGADILLSPSAWAVESDHDNAKDPYGDGWRKSYIPVAKEFSMGIFSASNVGAITAGPWEGRRCIGCSLAIDASGEEILEGPYGIDAECILHVDVSPVGRPARGTGWNAVWEHAARD